ncbi:MAG: hypothetical protein GOV15_04625 [Candidatus Diapherotrites archaeon]|nr:hypothetical protein [Candidatus Diapherotrites archaeon]
MKVDEVYKKGLKVAAESFANRLENGFVIGLGTSDSVLPFIKAIRHRMLVDDLDVKVVPTSLRVSNLLNEFKIPQVPLGDEELDVCLEFADRMDSSLNFVTTETHSLIRDKMIALSSKEVLIVVPEARMVLNGLVPFEVSRCAAAATLRALNVFGPARVRQDSNGTFVTDGSDLIVDVEIGKEYDLSDIETVAKRVPGVLETGIFYHVANKAYVLGEKVRIKNYDFSGPSGSIPTLGK